MGKIIGVNAPTLDEVRAKRLEDAVKTFKSVEMDDVTKFSLEDEKN